MAVQILRNYTTNGSEEQTLSTHYATRHGLEALAWVAIYCLFRKAHLRSTLLNNPASTAALEGGFCEIFDGITASNIAENRELALIQIEDPRTDPIGSLKPFIERELLPMARGLLLMVRAQNRKPVAGLDIGCMLPSRHPALDALSAQEMTCSLLRDS